MSNPLSSNPRSASRGEGLVLGAVGRIERFFLSDAIRSDPLGLMRARIGLYAALSGLPAGATGLFFGWVASEDLPHPGGARHLLVVGCSLLIYAAFPLLNRKADDPRRANAILVLTVMAILIYTSVMSGGPKCASLYWFPFVPVLAGFAVSARFMLVCSAIMVGAVTAIFVAAGRGFVFPELIPQVPALMASMLSWTVLNTALVVWYSHRGIDEALVALDVEVVHGREAEASLRASESMLRDAKQVAEDASAAKDSFLAYVSHEIRNPLSAITGALDLLAMDELQAKHPEYRAVLRRASGTIEALVNHILDLSKVESDQFRLDVRTVPLGELLSDVHQDHGVQADDAGLELRLVHDASTPPELDTDPVRLRQVLMNLIQNAIKFTPSGSVFLSVEPGETAAGQPGVRFAVRDTGPGIPASDLETIFEPYHQAETAARAPNRGTGLGLPICRRLVEVMGGALQVESTVGEGSCFSFVLPLVNPIPGTQIPERASAAAPSGLAARLLLVEDEPSNRAVVRELLVSLGHEVRVAGDGDEAIEAARETAFDLILMDVRMPRVDGLSAARQIRELEPDQGRQPAPIVAMTANVMPADRTACLEAGMNDVLGKPVTRKALAGVLARWVRP